MAYSDYGGYAYRNGVRVVERSDATICPDGSVLGTPGIWPGFVAAADHGVEEALRRDEEWPSGHAVLGDGPIYVVLYKQEDVWIHRGTTELMLLDVLAPGAPAGAVIQVTGRDGGTVPRLDREHFQRTGELCVFEVDGWRLEVAWREEDNFYVYAKLAQPDGTLWHGWSGYGVGAGLEECGYGYSTSEREDRLRDIWPESIKADDAENRSET